MQRLRLAQLAQESCVVARAFSQAGHRLRGRRFDPVCVCAHADAFAADVELHRLAEAVEEALECGDERGLLVRASQLEAGAARVEQQAVRPVCEFDDAVLEHASHRDVERRRLRAPWHRREPRRQSFRREQLPLGGAQIAGERERELIAVEPVVTDEREEYTGGGDESHCCDRDRDGQMGGEQ